MAASLPSGWDPLYRTRKLLGPEATATHSGLTPLSTGHQAKISQVPVAAFPSSRQRPVFTPGEGQGQCQEPPNSKSPFSARSPRPLPCPVAIAWPG